MGWCTAQCKMLPFCAKAIVKESRNFELEDEKENDFGRLVIFWFGTFMMLFFLALGCVFLHEKFENHRRRNHGC